MLDLMEEFREILAALEEAEVDCAVCGGLAVAIHVQPRATLDIDLLVPRENLSAAKDVARGRGYHIEAGPISLAEGRVELHRLFQPDPETGDLLSLDLLVVTEALVEAWEGRIRVPWKHGSVPVVSRAGLISMKRLRGSGQDADDIAALESDED